MSFLTTPEKTVYDIVRQQVPGNPYLAILVVAQGRLESSFNSLLFKNGNNPFGMKSPGAYSNYGATLYTGQSGNYCQFPSLENCTLALIQYLFRPDGLYPGILNSQSPKEYLDILANAGYCVPMDGYYAQFPTLVQEVISDHPEVVSFDSLVTNGSGKKISYIQAFSLLALIICLLFAINSLVSKT